MKLRRMIFPALCLMLSALCACTTVDGRVPGRFEVLAHVSGVCLDEKYKLESVKQIAEKPDNVEYTFRTEGRGLEFKANSYLSQVWIDTPTMFYTKEISCNYPDVVKELYYEDAKAVFTGDPQYMEDYGWYRFLSFDDVYAASRLLAQAAEIYSKELEYNSREFLEEHPVMDIHFVWFPSEQAQREHTEWVNIMDISVSAETDPEYYLEILGDRYAQLCVDGDIENRGDVPGEFLADKHVKKLEHIYLNGEEMLYDSRESLPWTSSPHSSDYKFSWYNYEMDSYMMIVDTGYAPENSSFPLIIREYVQKLDGDFHMEQGVRGMEWTLGRDTWTLRSVYSDNNIERFTVKKGFFPLDIPYITVDDDSHVKATFCVGIRAEDFCKLFNLRYKVDEAERSIYFYSR